MARVIQYKDFSDSKEIFKIESGKTIKESFSSIENWQNIKIFVNGKEENENYITKENDIIVLRTIPHMTGAAIAIGVLAIGAGVAAGVMAYKAKKDQRRMQKEIEKMKAQTKDDVANIPWLKGAKNSLSTGKTQPYIIGTHLFTPFILNGGRKSSKGYSTIIGGNGERQFYNVLLENGFNNQVIQKIYCDDIVLKNLGGFEPQEFPDKSGNKNLPFDSDSAFSSADSFIEIAQDGKDFSSKDGFVNDIFNYKIVEQQFSDELKLHAIDGEDDPYKDLFYTLEQNSMSADLCIMFNGLFSYNDNGVKGAGERNVEPYYSLDYAQIQADGGDVSQAHWIPFNFTAASWIPQKVTKKVGEYSGTYAPKYWSCGEEYGEDIKEILKNPSRWKFESGDDIRDDYDYDSMSYKTYWDCGSNYYEITVEKSIVTPGYWTDPKATTNFKGIFNSQIRYNAHIDFTFEQLFKLEDGLYKKRYSEPITIKVTSPDKTPKSGSVNNACYVQWIHSYTFDRIASSESQKLIPEKNIEKRAAEMSTLIGLHIEATEANQDKLNSIQVITTGCARTWNGADWSETKEPTSNPASWLLEILTSDKHVPSRLSDEEVDLEAFGELYEDCERLGYTVNYVIASGKTKSAILDLICSTCHAYLYQNIYGQVSVVMDKVNNNAIAILNEQNLISFSYDKEMTRKVDGVRVKYIDASNDYQEDSFIVMYDGTLNPEYRSPDSVLTDISADGITNFEEAYKYALYTMRCDRLRPKKCTAQVGKEAIYYTPLAKVKVQHPSLKNGLGSAEIKSVLVKNEMIVGFELYDAVTLDTDRNFNIIVQCVGSDYCSPRSYGIKNSQGRTKTIYLTEESAVSVYDRIRPKKSDILSYGYEVETITNEMLISDIAPTKDGFNLTLVDYDERIYSDGVEIPEYEPNITQPSTSSSKLPTSLPAPTMDDLMEVAKNAKVISKYAFDISPEFQSVPTSTKGEMSTDWFYIYAYLYEADELLPDVEYAAYIDGAKVGIWDGNKVKISTSYLKGDTLDIELTADYDGTTRYATATVSKLYAGEDGDLTLYKMQFPDGEKIKVDAGRTKYEPKALRVFKKKNTSEGEFDTNFGYITTEFVPGTEGEKPFETYEQVKDSESFETEKEYFGKYKPFLLSLGNEEVLGDNKGNALVFYERVRG